VTSIYRKVFSRAFRSRWDRENRWRIDGDMAEWSLWQIQLSVSMRKACGRLRYSSESWSWDVGLGSRHVLYMASGVFSPGPGSVVSKGLFDLRSWVSLCSFVIGNGLGAIICWGTLVSVWGLGSVLVLSCLGSACRDIVSVIGNGSSFMVSMCIGWVVKWVIPSSNITSWERKVKPVRKLNSKLE